MPFHISLIACDHSTQDMTRAREELSALVVEVWASPGVVAAARLVDGGKCGLLTTWTDKESFYAWKQMPSYRRLLDFFLRLSANSRHTFDCAFHEADITPPSYRPANAQRTESGAVVPLRRSPE